MQYNSIYYCIKLCLEKKWCDENNLVIDVELEVKVIGICSNRITGRIVIWSMKSSNFANNLTFWNKNSAPPQFIVHDVIDKPC